MPAKKGKKKTSAGTMHDQVQDDLHQMMSSDLADWLGWES
jgi:hypothetical protein